ncbi:hypothetical protein SAMN05192557_0393 [Aliicoccus persicus]|uniref:Uncharacterized protein n=1 Tax=Aliicoccus persicus TaxID=930138 RepID=A0A662Z2E2_9STAP|nr:hypothetical protein SAMN05192557_0393 [Aliicoccus persicus]
MYYRENVPFHNLNGVNYICYEGYLQSDDTPGPYVTYSGYIYRCGANHPIPSKLDSAEGDV